MNERGYIDLGSHRVYTCSTLDRGIGETERPQSIPCPLSRGRHGNTEGRDELAVYGVSVFWSHILVEDTRGLIRSSTVTPTPRVCRGSSSLDPP